MKSLSLSDTAMLAAVIAMASDVAASESTEEEDVNYDVRVSPERGIYTVLREHEDGGAVLWSTVSGLSVDPVGDARRVIAEEAERRKLAAPA